MPETALLTGTLEITNEPYAVAKIAGISEVIPAMMRRFYEAKQRGDSEVVVWVQARPC